MRMFTWKKPTHGSMDRDGGRAMSGWAAQRRRGAYETRKEKRKEVSSRQGGGQAKGKREKTSKYFPRLCRLAVYCRFYPSSFCSSPYFILVERWRGCGVQTHVHSSGAMQLLSIHPSIHPSIYFSCTCKSTCERGRGETQTLYCMRFRILIARPSRYR